MYEKIIEAIKSGKRVLQPFAIPYDIKYGAALVSDVVYNTEDEYYEYLKVFYADGTFDNAACLDDEQLTEIYNNLQ